MNDDMRERIRQCEAIFDIGARRRLLRLRAEAERAATGSGAPRGGGRKGVSDSKPTTTRG